jgi:outer membrane protein OmpA-like peptidoglycan-associated protein
LALLLAGCTGAVAGGLSGTLLGGSGNGRIQQAKPQGSYRATRAAGVILVAATTAAKPSGSLDRAVAQAAPTPAAPTSATPADVNLLSPLEGGQVIIAPTADWQAVINGQDKTTLNLSGCNSGVVTTEAVFAFAEEKPATFAKFQILIPGAGGWVKDFELLAADDAPIGPYRSLGKFTTLNALSLKSPYQEFAFPETTASYLKLRLLSAHGGCPPALTQIRLVGHSSVAKAPVDIAKSIRETGKVDIYGINFDVDKTNIKPESAPTLEQVAKVLKDDPSLKLEVAGHTDNTGGAEHNMKLSGGRAAAVVAALVKQYGIAAARLQAKGYGDTRPVASNDTDEGRAKNRRVELRNPAKTQAAAAAAAPAPASGTPVVTQVAPLPAKPPASNLLAAAQGGQLLTAANAGWQAVISGKDADQVALPGCNGMTEAPEAVFAFKDEKPAAFDKFAMLIPSEGPWVKDFELLAADDAPAGTFRSLGKFTTYDALFFKSPYQVFGFPTTTAKYLKLKVLSSHGGCPAALTQVALIGTQDGAQLAASPPPAAPAEDNLLLPANGGQLIAAPGQSWDKAISGSDADTVGFSGCNGLPTEAIFAFKDERPATFDKFTMLITRGGPWVKDFEILAADETPTGDYRSLGKFTAQNMLMIKTPYQEFSFPATTAKYFKLRILTGQPSDCGNYLTQIRLFGKLGDAPAAAAAAPAEINLLDPKRGGQLLAAPDPSWQAIISGNDADAVRFSACGGLPAEAIFAFKDEQPASFDKIAVLIAQSGQNIKDFEVLAADDSPGGTYRSLGKFTVLNMRLVKTPYQEFAFAETTAKYVKFRLLTGQAGDCNNVLTQIRVMGKAGS